MPFDFLKRYIERRVKSNKHPASNVHQKKLYPCQSSINSQSQSIFFTLPPEIRIIIYELLFGNRSLHYQCDWVEETRNWVIYSYTESLPILYGSNEFRFKHQKDTCNTFPAQIPSLGLPAIRRLTFWWSLETDIQPHMSRHNKAKYDSLWNAPGTTFSLSHIRIYIDCPSLRSLAKMPKGVSENAKNSYIQHAWLDGIEAMVEANEDLEVFEVHFYTGVYQVLKEKVKPWLGEMENKRKVQNSAVKYKAYKCRTTTIKRQACFGTGAGGGYDTDISDGSSHIGLEHPMTIPNAFWMRKIKEQINSG
ncbi:hypothetical protein N7520_008598 [Penicillium odoratum]|uniref:uncharacterized protein n=1 Tax=Penicillium odoratum TaxID=1167516 RepID=UPI0025474432|nr:uncharacterized protein N7520_008598 [Penicillium odoratum]KAJ5751681.1 hypothetical protein N7520_008598 [Penicillium odoratum]